MCKLRWKSQCDELDRNEGLYLPTYLFATFFRQRAWQDKVEIEVVDFRGRLRSEDRLEESGGGTRPY